MNFITPNNWLRRLEPHIQENPFTMLMSVSQVDRLGDVDPIVYNWDMYSWIDYDNHPWKEFVSLLPYALEIWHPSEAARRQMQNITGLDAGEVIKTFVPTEWLDEDIEEGGYVLFPMRFYEKDEHFTWFKRACNELGVYGIQPDHDYAGDYKTLLQHARLIVSPYREASTGGLGIIEGTYSGKSVLAFDGPLNGAKEYLGERGHYFTTYEEFRDKLKALYDHPPKLDLEECREWVRANYSVEAMAKQVNERCSILLQADR